ncbi:MAG: DegT/DnrJ/EryC1/StrS family aminotransferase [Cyclobacteriaceae bacterium]|nr:DegT/DnrJ/EryC1/StrS family aminotransferase [Cyclobacteriaceae bacterium]
MNIPLVDLHRQYQQHKQALDEAIGGVIAKSAFIGNLNNPFVKAFEADFAVFVGLKHCIACGNGTDSIEILLKSMGIGAGDEVIVPAISWIATSEAVSNMGAVPIFVDVDPDHYCIDPTLIESKITERTRAIIPVHLYGHPADMPAILQIADKHGLQVLEDCAQAHGAEIDGQQVGTFGHAASFSFFPGKNLGAFGDAGGMLTNDDQIAQKARMIAQHGQSGQKHTHLIEGRNSRMDGIHAAVLSVKLPLLRQWTAQRIAHAYSYSDLLSGLAMVLPQAKSGYKHVFHLYVIRTSRREALIAHLKAHGISTTIQYPTALPFLDAYQHLRHKTTDFPVAARLQHEVISIPMFPELTEEEIGYIGKNLKLFNQEKI